MKSGDLVLCDIGVKKWNLLSDITTTFPVNGKFSELQKKLYNVVLDAQLQAISEIKPGIEYRKVVENCKRKLAEGLIEIGILKGDLEEVHKSGAVSVFMPHGISHYVGMYNYWNTIYVKYIER